MRYIYLLLLLSASTNLFSANLDSLKLDAEPAGGIEELARAFFSIPFPEELRVELDRKRVELIFYIDELGVPELEAVIGIDHPRIIDSFIQKTAEIPLFEAAQINGNYLESYYVLILTYPSLDALRHNFYRQRLKEFCETNYQDFRNIEFHSFSSELVVGGFFSPLMGNINNYAKAGGGFFMTASYHLKNNWSAGFSLNLSFHKVKEPIPIQSPNPRLNSLQIGNLGLLAGKWFSLAEKPNAFKVQLDLSMVFINVTKRLSENDPNWEQIRGFSPALSFHYPILIGNPSKPLNCRLASLSYHQLNLHTTIRPLFTDNSHANGLMFEMGASYRLSSRRVKSWELK